MEVYRVAAKAYSMDLIGEGARRAGARWNPQGIPVIYMAEHPTLAMLEIMAHLDRSCAPTGLQLATITIPDGIGIYAPSLGELPPDWDSRPEQMSTVLFGKKWLEEGDVPVLKVPSVMPPYGKGWNLLLNPLHPELLGKMGVNVDDWAIDPRLFP